MIFYIKKYFIFICLMSMSALAWSDSFRKPMKIYPTRQSNDYEVDGWSGPIRTILSGDLSGKVQVVKIIANESNVDVVRLNEIIKENGYHVEDMSVSCPSTLLWGVDCSEFIYVNVVLGILYDGEDDFRYFSMKINIDGQSELIELD